MSTRYVTFIGFAAATMVCLSPSGAKGRAAAEPQVRMRWQDFIGGPEAASGLTVIIEATHGRTATDPARVQEQRDAAGKAFRAEAKLQIGAIELRAVPSSRR